MRDSKQDVLHFWFEESQPAQWFQVNPDYDRLIRDRFSVVVRMAREGLCDLWADDDADGALALCIVLDQFPRNIFRGQADAFASDAKALEVARAALARGYDRVMVPLRRRFLYLPFEHSERIADQEKSVSLFESMRDQDPLGYDYALRHRDVILRFGRFPHRNAALGRISTAEELVWLENGGGF